MDMESHVRSIFKALSWRVLATATTLMGVWVFSGEVGLAVTVAAFDTIVKLAIYYGHERAWNTVPWGRKSSVEQ